MKVALEQSKNIAKLEKFFNISASTRWDLDMIDDAYESGEIEFPIQARMM